MDTVQQLKAALRETFPELVKGQHPTTLNNANSRLLHAFVMGFVAALQAKGLEVPPIIVINLSCGRVDRFLKEG